VTLLRECLDEYVAEENPVRVVDVLVDELDLVLKVLILLQQVVRPTIQQAC
jgi:transposase